MHHGPTSSRRRAARRTRTASRALAAAVAGAALLALSVQALPAAAAATTTSPTGTHHATRAAGARAVVPHVAPVRRRLHLATPRAAVTPASSRGPAARALAARQTRALDDRLGARTATRAPHADPLSGEGGSVVCIEGSTIQLSQTMAYGTSGTLDVDPSDPALGADSVCTLTGVVPAGWTVYFAPYSVHAVPNVDGTAGVEGSLTLGSSYDGFNNSCYGAQFVGAAGMTFVNEGTFTQASFNGAPYDEPSCGYPDPNVTVENFVQAPGATLGVPAATSWDFNYDNATTPGTFTNDGTITVPATSTVQVANGNCTEGLVFVSEPGSTVALTGSGTFEVSCGGIDVEGGSVTGGAIDAGGTHLSVTFGTSVPAGSTGSIDIPGASSTLTGTIAPAWTVAQLNGGTITAAPGSANDGTLQFTSSTLSDTGTFTNAGTLDAFGGGTIVTPDLVNTGLLEVTAYGPTDADTLSFTYDNATTPGVLDNTGTVHVDARQQLVLGPQGCATGTDFVAAGGTIDNAGTFQLQCGELDLDGGTITASGPAQVTTNGHTLVDFDTGLAAGTTPGTDTVEFTASGASAEGTIPSGWTVILDGHPVAFAAGTTNDGTVQFAAYGSGLTDPGVFTNHGTMTVEAGVSATVVTPDLENTATIDELGTGTGGSALDFNYDSPTGAGLLDNTGSITAAGGQLTVGTQSCQHGEDLVEGAGSSLAATAGNAHLYVQCGELDLNGGSIASGGPVEVEPVGTVLVDFDAGLVAGSGGTADTVELEASGYSVEGAIPAGWTLDDASHVAPLANGTSNAGAIELSAYGAGLSDAGTFTNTGTVTVASGESASIDVQQLSNAGTIEELGTSSNSTALSFTYDSAGGAGTITNTGTIEALGGQLTVGPQSCQHGEDLVESGPAATLEAAATVSAFYVQCGELDLNGGSIASGGPIQVEPVGAVLVDFDAGLAAAASGTSDTVELEATSNTVEGAIPTGWTLEDDGHPFSSPSGTSNAGTISLLAYGSGVSDPGTFTNSGTITAVSGVSASLDVQQLTNTGTIEELGTSANSTELSFTYDGASGAGTIANTGTIEALGGQLTVGPQSCQHGEDLVEGAGSSLAAAAGNAHLYVQCGELDLNGGSIAAGGPVEVSPVGSVLVDFDTGLAQGAGGTSDTVELEGGATTVLGTVPAGWTLDDAGHAMTVLAGTTNDGLLELSAYGSGLSGTPGTFTNDGTIDVTNSAVLFATSATTLDNTGTIDVTANNSLDGSQTSLDNTGTVDLGQNASLEPQLGFTQGSAGTLGVAVNGNSAPEVSVPSGPASLAGTLAITTGTLPSEGSALTVVQSSGALTGTFSPVTGRYPGSVGYLPAYTSTQARLEVLFTQGITFTSSAPSDAVFDGAPYTVSATGGASGNPVTFSVPASSASVCSVAGDVVSFTGVGTCEVDADQAGAASYLAAQEAAQSFAVARAPQAITFTSSAPSAASVGGTTYTVTATGGASGSPVTFSVPASSASVCTVSGDVVSFTGVGTCEVDADQAGDAEYLAAPTQPQSFAVAQGAQTITFTSTPPAHAGVGGTYDVTTTGGGSGNPVTLSVPVADTAVCSASGDVVHLTGVGTCEVDANEAGDSDYLAAPEQSQTFAVGKATNVITVTSHAPTTAVVGGGYLPTATATSGDTVVVSVATTSTGCTLSSGAVHFVSTGTCVLHFNDAGNASYAAATQVAQSFVISKRSLTLKASASPATASSSRSVRLTATLSVKTSGTVTFTYKGTTLCSAKVSGGVASCKVTVSLKKGTYAVKASYTGNAAYAGASATTSFKVT